MIENILSFLSISFTVAFALAYISGFCQTWKVFRVAVRNFTSLCEVRPYIVQAMLNLGRALREIDKRESTSARFSKYGEAID